MRYIGRHRAPRPLYLRRPVVGGVVVAALISVPALALTNPGNGLLGADADPSPSSSSTSPTAPATVVPTDGVLPEETTAPTSSAVRPTSAPATTTSTGASVPTTTRTTRPTTKTTRPTTTTTTTTTTKPPAPLKLSVSAPGTGTVGTAYAGSASASGGVKPYAFSGSGSLPPGVTVKSSGTISGTPTTAGSYSFSVRVTDKNGSTRSAAVSVTIAAAEPEEPAGGLLP